jgi:hypothetical protein
VKTVFIWNEVQWLAWCIDIREHEAVLPQCNFSCFLVDLEEVWNRRDCSLLDKTLYTVSPSSSNPQTFRKIYAVAFVKAASVPSPQNVVRTRTTTLDECIGLCATYNEANKTSIRNRTGSELGDREFSDNGSVDL